MVMSSEGHATNDPIASRSNVVSETMSSTGRIASRSNTASTDTFRCPSGSGLW